MTTDKSKPMGVALLRLSARDLANLLDFPDYFCLERMHVTSRGMEDNLEIIVVGPGLPVLGEGVAPSELPVAFEEQYVSEFDDNRRFLDWGAMLKDGEVKS